jgi:hypothetical protein
MKRVAGILLEIKYFCLFLNVLIETVLTLKYIVLDITLLCDKIKFNPYTRLYKLRTEGAKNYIIVKEFLSSLILYIKVYGPHKHGLVLAGL